MESNKVDFFLVEDIRGVREGSGEGEKWAVGRKRGGLSENRFVEGLRAIRAVCLCVSPNESQEK